MARNSAGQVIRRTCAAFLFLRVERIMKTRLLSVPGRLAVLALLALCALGAARAEDGDPPGQVARLSDIEGSVSLQPAGVQEWAAATLNRPLTTGDKLWTDQSSRAELDIGAAAIRLGATTGFSFLNLDDNTAQMQVSAGTLIVHVRDLQGQTNEIDTPNVALSLQQPGTYRVEVNDAGDTTVVKVSEGQAKAAGGGQSVAIGAQQAVRFTAPTHSALRAPPSERPMIWTAGPRGASASCRTHPRASRSRTTSPARRIWIPTDVGRTRPTTVTSGHQPWSSPAGRRTVSVSGYGSPRGVGPGSMTRPGVMHRFTMAAGCSGTAPGAGCRARGVYARCTRPRWWPGWVDLRAGFPWRSAPTSAGSRSR